MPYYILTVVDILISGQEALHHNSDCASAPAGADVGSLAPCTHEEADTRMYLHVAAATIAGHRHVMVRTNDSDVVVLGVSTVVTLGQRIDELWIAFGTRGNFR